MDQKNNQLQRNLSWTAGLSIALGVPLLLIPSISYFSNYLWAFAIILIGISVLEGFFQNMAFGELAVDFPQASGPPGYVQEITSKNGGKFSSFLGGFSSWCYWFAWVPMPAIFALTIQDFLLGLFPSLHQMNQILLTLLLATVIFWGIFAINRRGTGSNDKFGLILNLVALLPLFLVAVIPFLNGAADFSNITDYMLPSDFRFDGYHLLLLFGLFGMAQWSTCAWETAAVYGPEYKNPNKDVPKALISCGIICLVVFISIQVACTATIGVAELNNATKPAILLVTQQCFGTLGVMLMTSALIIGMMTIIQTGFSGASRALFSLSQNGNLPSLFGNVNKNGAPQNAMLATVFVNYFLLLLRKPSAIVAASSVGYAIATGFALYAYVYYKREKNKLKSGKSKNFSMPRYWDKIVAFFAILNVPFFVGGLFFLNTLDGGKSSIFATLLILGIYIPLYLYTKHKIKLEQVQSSYTKEAA